MDHIKRVLVNQAQAIVDKAALATDCVPPPGPSSKIWLGFDFYHPALHAAKRALVDWHNGGYLHGTALVLAGNCGSGKTHLARVVRNAVSHSMIYPEPDLIADIQATYGRKAVQTEAQIIRDCRDVALLIIDDVGAGYVKQDTFDDGWLFDKYWRIIDRRAEAKHPLMITTNLTFEALCQRLGERAGSRLLGMMGSKGNYIDLFDVPDYRLRGFKKC